MIYFVSVDDSYIKIGYSANPKKRISQLQTGSPKPLTLHGIIDGSQADEQRLHTKHGKPTGVKRTELFDNPEQFIYIRNKLTSVYVKA